MECGIENLLIRDAAMKGVLSFFTQDVSDVGFFAVLTHCFLGGLAVSSFFRFPTFERVQNDSIHRRV